MFKPELFFSLTEGNTERTREMEDRNLCLRYTAKFTCSSLHIFIISNFFSYTTNFNTRKIGSSKEKEKKDC